MNKTLRNPWFLLTCCFLLINTYGVLRIKGPCVPVPAPDAAVPSPQDPEASTWQPILLQHVLQVDQDEQGRIVLSLIFNQVISPKVLERFLAITGNDGTPIDAHIPGQSPSQRLDVALQVSPRAALTVTVRKGLYAESGEERLEADITRGLLLQPGIALTQLRPHSPPFASPGIQLSFSRPVNVASLRNAIAIEPAVDFTVTEGSDWFSGRTYQVSGSFTRGRNYTLHIRAGLRAESGNHSLSEDLEQVFYLPDAEPAIRIPYEGRFLSSHGNRILPLEIVNVSDFTVEAARLPTHNLVQYAMREGRHYRGFWNHPGSQITIPEVEKTFTLEIPRNRNIVHQVPLADLLPKETEAGAWQIQVRHGENRLAENRLLVISDIGITVRHAPREMLVWANSIHSLDPLSEARVQVWSAEAELLLEGQTDSQGIAILPLTGDKLTPFMVTVKSGKDLSFISLPDTLLPQGAAATDRSYLAADALEAFVYSDRGVYRPGETSHVRAILRGNDMLLPDLMPVFLHAIRPDGREHSRHPAMLSTYGTAEFTLPWKDFDATGKYRLELRSPGANEALGSTQVAIEDFVPPRMAVELRLEADPARPAGSAHVSGRYLYGAPAAQSRFQLSLHALPRTFVPKSFPDYAFGNPERSLQTKTYAIGQGNLDQHGEAALGFLLPETLQPPAMIEAIVTSTVHEQGGRTVSAAARSPMHVYPYYIGIHKPDLQQPAAGQTTKVGIQLVSQDGSAFTAALPLTVTLQHVRWNTILIRDTQGRYRFESERQVMPLHSSIIQTDAQGVAYYPLTGHHNGHHQLMVESAEGVSSAYPFAIGLDAWQERSMERPDRVELQWDQERYQPGDIARLSVTAPFGGRALLTVEQDSVVMRDTQLMEGNHTIFMVHVTEAMRPNAHASVHVIRALPPNDERGRQSARATGTLPLLLHDQDQRLQVVITAPGTSRPGAPLPVSLQVRHPDGSPAKAEIAIAAIDEAICMLTDFRTPDPVGFFTALRRGGFQASDLYAMLLPESDPEEALYHAHTGGDVGSLLRGRLNPVRSRRFQPLALWQGAVETDDQGHASVNFDIPEFSGQLRLMAVAVTPARMGSGEERVVINRPLTVLASLPRFLAPGDQTVMPIELHHMGTAPTEGTLDIAVTGSATLAGTNNFSIVLAPGARKTLEVPIQAGQAPGLAHFTITVHTGGKAIVDTIELPVRPAIPYQVFQTNLVLNAGISQTLPPQTNWIPGTAKASLHISALPDLGLSGALTYLMDYPYGCLEQTLSSAFSLLTLRKNPEWSGSPHIATNPENLLPLFINRILTMQTASGGFGWWPQASTDYPWGSVYAMHLLIEARTDGISIPTHAIDTGLANLRQILARPMQTGQRDSFAWRSDAGLRAYICTVLARAGTPRHDWNERLREQVEWMDVDSRLHLVLALAASGRHRDARELLEATDDVPTQAYYADGGSLITPARTAALSLFAWLEIDPQSPRITDHLHALMAHQQEGRWRTTQENAAAFRALARYLELHADPETTFTATIHQPNTDTRPITDKTPPLTIDPGQALAITNNGPGRLYATLAVQGIPVVPPADADHGIRIRRRYLDLQQHPIDDTYIPQGTLIIVELRIDTQARSLDNLVIEDLLPAGLEIENPNLKTTELVQWAKTQTDLPLRQMENRDDRIILFTDEIQGIRRFYYAARAVTPGTYTRPPVSAEGMYNPERRSTHHSGTLTIE